MEMAGLAGDVESALHAEVETWTEWPQDLKEVCVYALFTGGKRIRPVLGLMVGQALRAELTALMPWVVAVEMIHTYSLIHDDLPAMDDDNIRRGQPTCHIKFGEALAILAGDALLTRAFNVVAESPSLSPAKKVELVRLLGRIAGGAGMVGGQVMDISGTMVNESSVVRMQALKTGALICGAAEGAAVAAGASDHTVKNVAEFGRALGLLFQLTDDLLDRDEDLAEGGNNILHHIDESALKNRINVVSAKARSALDAVGQDVHHLLALVDRIAQRTV